MHLCWLVTSSAKTPRASQKLLLHLLAEFELRVRVAIGYHIFRIRSSTIPFSSQLRFLLSGTMASTTARMSDTVRAQCYAMRNPPKGEKPMPYDQIAQTVTKTDGTHPTEGAVWQAVRDLTKGTVSPRKLKLKLARLMLIPGFNASPTFRKRPRDKSDPRLSISA